MEAPARPGALSPLISVRDLVKRYGDRTILDGVTFDVHRGETLAVIGSSGSGKTTLARLLIGLERPTSGHVFVGGVDLAELGEYRLGELRRRFAMVFQKYAMLDSMTVYDNVAFPLREETDLDEDAIHCRVMAALDELGVADAAGKLPGELSGGMAKRVGIARAVVVEPEILIYDEPTSGLDPATSRTVDALIERMREQHLVTSIVITHDMVTARAVADRVLVLAHGKVAACGPPESILARLERAADGPPAGVRNARQPPDEIRARWEAHHTSAAHQDQRAGRSWWSHRAP